MAEEAKGLTPYLGPGGALALSLGTSMGWGALFIASGTYLAKAGPVGSALGMLAGGLVMLVIGWNYHYMMISRPEAGGVYAYARDCFGHDHGFLAAWFLILVYLAIFLANATALPLFARYFFGHFFEFGRLYALFDYNVYLGELLLTAGAIVCFAMLCSGPRKTVSALMNGFASCFALAIAVCFAFAMGRHGPSFEPAFVPDAGQLSQIAKIAFISSWAFIGFESISHSAEEFSFKPARSYRVLACSVVATTLLYVFIALLSATAWPPQYDSWYDYILDLDRLQGIEGLPAFYAARHHMGEAGVAILMAALLCLVLSSLAGNAVALSRLLYALARDGILARRYVALNRHGVPAETITLIAGTAMAASLFGRTAIGWIVDVTTIGATLIYGFVSACAWKQAGIRGDALEKATGVAGTVAMACFGLWLLAPSLFSESSIEPESYFLFVLWSVLGLLFFRNILHREKQDLYGHSLVVWVSLLSLILFVSLVWMSQSVMKAATEGINAAHVHGALPGGQPDAAFVARQVDLFRTANAQSLSVVILLFGLALGAVLNNYAAMRRRAAEIENRLGIVERKYTIDTMTGARSKHAFADAEEALDKRIAAGTAGPFALAVCDVNGLKHVNDTRGHKAGDEYICAAFSMICLVFAHSPVYRTGGDEFVVLLQGADYDRRHDLMHGLHDLSVSHIASGEVVVSGGLADFDAGADRNLHAVFERADALMYKEKKLLKSMGARTR